MIGRRFVHSALRLPGTHRGNYVPGIGSGVQFLHKNIYISGKIYAEGELIGVDDDMAKKIWSR